MDGVLEPFHVFQFSEEIWVLHDEQSGLVIEPHYYVIQVRRFWVIVSYDGKSHALSVRAHYLPVLRMQFG